MRNYSHLASGEYPRGAEVRWETTVNKQTVSQQRSHASQSLAPRGLRPHRHTDTDWRREAGTASRRGEGGGDATDLDTIDSALSPQGRPGEMRKHPRCNAEGVSVQKVMRGFMNQKRIKEKCPEVYPCGTPEFSGHNPNLSNN